jgi:hypothetical protein
MTWLGWFWVVTTAINVTFVAFNVGELVLRRRRRREIDRVIGSVEVAVNKVIGVVEAPHCARCGFGYGFVGSGRQYRPDRACPGCWEIGRVCLLSPGHLGQHVERRSTDA